MHVFVIHRLGFNWQIALKDSAINNTLLLVLSFAMVMALHYYTPSKSKSLLLFGWSIILAMVCAWLSNLILSKVFEADSTYMAIHEQSFLIRF